MISSTKERHEPRWRSFARLKDVRGRYHQWMDTLPERVRQKTTHLEKEKELGHLSNGARRFILGVIVTFSLILALICITQHLTRYRNLSFCCCCGALRCWYDVCRDAFPR
ncbi:Cellulose biosynthesis protein catalytic subunit A [Salmonella enterica subsp. enterica]|uniref:Cellulose biosynthesis protein catalytic subunit A n=1 Tax=Salmonella enterica I TaxID=59201 RepID=A0A379UWP9_SALET|nr:Cellulose biosynthesis protein catalytic subunit A [Salmonella enterica subsp. enterica]